MGVKDKAKDIKATTNITLSNLGLEENEWLKRLKIKTIVEEKESQEKEEKESEETLKEHLISGIEAFNSGYEKDKSANSTKNKEKDTDGDYNDFLESLRKYNPFDRDTAFDIPDNLTIEQTGKNYTSGNLCQKIEFIAKVSAEFERELAIMKSAILTFIDGSN